MKQIITVFIMSAVALTSQAQDWQIGGGAGGTQRYHFDLPQRQQATPQPKERSYEYFDLFDGAHDDAPYAFTIGYVNKYWRTDFGDYVWHENFWGEEGKRIHGLQLGFTYQPCLPMGLGLHTGLFWELYYSVSPAVREMGWDNFTEHNLYLPLHAMWRVPIDRECSISLFGGLGVNWALYGTYNSEHYEEYYDWREGVCVDHWTDYNYATYGNGDWPHHFNLSTEFGTTVRIQRAQLTLTFSHGLTDHDFYKNVEFATTQGGQFRRSFKTTQNKVGISLSFLLNKR